jgi:hypothetical protein
VVVDARGVRKCTDEGLLQLLQRRPTALPQGLAGRLEARKCVCQIFKFSPQPIMNTQRPKSIRILIELVGFFFREAQLLEQTRG